MTAKDAEGAQEEHDQKPSGNIKNLFFNSNRKDVDTQKQ